MKDGKNVIIIILTILVLAMGGYLIYDHAIVKEIEEVGAKKENKTEERQKEEKEAVDQKQESQEAGLTKEEALTIANDVYTKAYGVVQEGVGFVNSSMNKFDSSKVQNLFTTRELYYLETRYQASSDGFINTMVNTIFGTTNQLARTLSIIDYSNNLIVAEGKTVIDCSECSQGLYCSCPNDQQAHVITLRNENGTWLIDYFD